MTQKLSLVGYPHSHSLFQSYFHKFYTVFSVAHVSLLRVGMPEGDEIQENVGKRNYLAQKSNQIRII